MGVGHATALGDDEEEDDSRLTTGDGRMKDDGGAWQMMTDDDRMMTGFNRIFNPKAASILNWLVTNAVHF